MTERKTNHPSAAAALALAVALAALFVLLSGAPRAAVAGPLAQGQVDTVAIDTDTSGNSASALGSREGCRQVAPGETFDVDITIDAIPAVADPTKDGLAGLQFILRYDSQLLTLNMADRNFILTVDPDSALIPSPTSDPTELNAGPPRVVIFGNMDAGGPAAAEQAIKGVATRLTFTASASGSGVSEIIILDFFDPNRTKILQVDVDMFSIGQLVGGAIAVSPASCSGVTPQPTTSPGTLPPPGTTPPADTTPAPADSTPGTEDTPPTSTTPGAGATPSLTPTADASPQPAATQTAVAQATAAASGDDNGDDGGIGWLPILIIVLVVVAGGLAAGGWALRRRFRT